MVFNGGMTMHELAVTKSILRLVLNSANQVSARKVKAIYLQIGELRNLEQEWIQRYFDYISANTIAEGASIKVQKVPAVFRCQQCGRKFGASFNEGRMVVCTYCGSEEYLLLSGRELQVEKMEVI